jgi:hypothetical protein
MKTPLLLALSALLAACQTTSNPYDVPNPAYTQVYKAPAFKHKVIDAETKLPLPGVIVWGFWDLEQGSLAGGKTGGATLRQFEVVTDANGEYSLPAWESQPYTGWMRPSASSFPLITFYKRGYTEYILGSGSLYGIRPNVNNPGFYPAGKWTDNADKPIDLRSNPQELAPAKTIRERYDAYVVSGMGTIRIAQPCGFLDSPKILVAWHYEWKYLLSQLVPAQYLNKEGYVALNYSHPDLYYRSGTDGKSLIDSITHWPCTTAKSTDLLINTKDEK